MLGKKIENDTGIQENSCKLTQNGSKFAFSLDRQTSCGQRLVSQKSEANIASW
jgi:hypothetical protein